MPTAFTWNRWEQTLATTKQYDNPYADVTLSVTYTGPEGQSLTGYGFWDGDGDFKIRAMFPSVGPWTWRTHCSDTTNSALHNQSGTVMVAAYTGNNSPYQHGYLKVSDNGRYLMHADGCPFLWIGDTTWLGYTRSTRQEWEAYIDHRRDRGFTVIVMGCSVVGSDMDRTDRQGNPPFIDEDTSRWNPDFWRGFDEKIQFANDRGILVVVTGVGWGRLREAPLEQRLAFARNLAARLAGNHVIFSPHQDWGGVPDEAIHRLGREIKGIVPRHLVTQHPKRRPMPDTVIGYHHQPYMDFTSVQTGPGPDIDDSPLDLNKSSRATIEWLLALYRESPPKPIINLEGLYDDDYFRYDDRLPGQPRIAMVRRGGYLSFLCGAYGFTSSTFGVWSWGNPADNIGGRDDPPDIKTAMNRPYATHLSILSQFSSQLEWWRLEPCHQLIKNQPDNWARKMVLSKSATGDLAVAYLPDNPHIIIDMTMFPAPMTARWFHPVTNEYQNVPEPIPNSGQFTFNRPSGWEDAAIILAKQES